MNEAVQLDPQYTTAYNDRSSVCLKLGEPREAVADLNQAVQLDPELAGAYRDRAMTNTLLGRDTAAQEDCERAVELGLDAASWPETWIKQQR